MDVILGDEFIVWDEGETCFGVWIAIHVLASMKRVIPCDNGWCFFSLEKHKLDTEKYINLGEHSDIDQDAKMSSWFGFIVCILEGHVYTNPEVIP